MDEALRGSWLPLEPGSSPLSSALASAPVLEERFKAMVRQVWCPPVADPVLLELARLRIAQLLRSEADMRLRFTPAIESGLDETKIAELPHWPTSPRFSETERAVLAFTEVFAMDAHAVSHEQCAALTATLPREAVAGVTMAMAVFEAVIRLRLGLGPVPPGPPDPVTVVDPSTDPLH